MKKIFQIIKSLGFKTDILRNISILISGTALAQIIPLVLQPVLRRYYPPEAFGAFSVYLSIVGILVVIASFKYELAIVLPKKDKEAANILFLSFVINLFFNLLLAIVLIFFSKPVYQFLNLPAEYRFIVFMVPAGVFLYNFYQSLNYWLIRKKGFLALSKNKFIRRGVEGATQVGFQFFKINSGLMIGDITGHVANIISGLVQSARKGLSLKYLSINKLRYVISKYAEYPKFNIIPSFLSASSYLFPAIIINKLFSSAYTGYYDLSKQVLSIPLALVAVSISNVLLERISERYKARNKFIHEMAPIAILIFFIAFLEIMVIRLFGPELFGFIFGNEWKYSGEISHILVWSYAFNFFIASFSSVFIAMKKIKLLSAWQILYFLAILLLFFFKDYEFVHFLKVYVIIEVICYVSLTIMMIIVLRNYTFSIRK